MPVTPGCVDLKTRLNGSKKRSKADDDERKCLWEWQSIDITDWQWKWTPTTCVGETKRSKTWRASEADANDDADQTKTKWSVFVVEWRQNLFSGTKDRTIWWVAVEGGWSCRARITNKDWKTKFTSCSKTKDDPLPVVPSRSGRKRGPESDYRRPIWKKTERKRKKMRRAETALPNSGCTNFVTNQNQLVKVNGR